ncbi:MAG: hypothetical protein IT225_05690 [Flavobacteriales bacterium]|nr:hypothetical protein [Flavobacteriales bacterium]
MLAAALFIAACHGTKPTAFSHQVSLAEPEQAPGLLWINGNGEGNSRDKAVHDAQRAIFEQLLFRGIAGSSWSRPMVPDEANSKLEHPDLYKALLDDLGYRPFILAAQHGTLDKKTGTLTTKLHIDTNALRKHLEQHGIIRPFGL